MKIAHLADIHCRSLSRHLEYRESFSDLFVKLRALKPDIILIAGDIVHSKTQGISPEIISLVVWIFSSLAEIAELHVTLGNHDGLILNPDRDDAISPIISAMNNKKIKLYKKSGVYKIKQGYNLCVFSCFDEQNWINVKPIVGDVNIATFHGAVNGSQTDENWDLTSHTNVSFFEGFDYTLLGDIHKQQVLDYHEDVILEIDENDLHLYADAEVIS